MNRLTENLARVFVLACVFGFGYLVMAWLAEPHYPPSIADEPGWDEYVAACGPHGTHRDEDVCVRWEDGR